MLDSATKKCTQSSLQVSNCKSSSLLGGCLHCNEGFFLQNKECVRIPENQFISNCGWFDQNKCQICEKGYFFNGETCQIAGDKIRGCEYYNFKDQGKTCLQCVSGKVMVGGQCVEQVNDFQNCAHFVDFSCKKCASGFKFNENMLLSTMLDESNNSLFSLENYLKSQEINFFKPPVLFCQRQYIENCRTYDSEGKCISCDENFSLLNQKCLVVSNANIPFCIKFANIVSCQECDSDYFLNSQNICHPNTKVDHCSEFSKFSEKTKCLKCESGFYLSGSSCVRRIASRIIPACLLYSPDSDSCFQCNETTILTSDLLKCLPLVANCQTYFPSNRESSQLECSRCNPGFHFDQNGECIGGTDQNCAKFRLYSNVCEECKQEFFLESSSKTCVHHELNPACSSYNTQIRDKCDGHHGNYREIIYANKCVPLQLIDKCEKYSKSKVESSMLAFSESTKSSSGFWASKLISTCLECQEGFQPSEDSNSCISIHIDANCLKVSDSKCVLCKNDKIVSSKGTCVDIPTIESSFCESPSQSSLSRGCAQCSDDSFPISPNFSILCFDQENLDLLENTTEHCETYQANWDGSKKCVSCDIGFSLNQSSGCVPENTCDWIIKHPFSDFSYFADPSGNFYDYEKYELFGKASSICKESSDYPSGLSGCKIFVPGIKGKLACIECESDKFPLYDISTGSAISDKNYVKFDSSGNFLGKVSFRQEISECVLKSTISAINNCKKYYRYDTNQIGCLSCEFGFFGKVESNKKEIGECVDVQESECDSSQKFEGLGWEYEERSILNFSFGKKHKIKIRIN